MMAGAHGDARIVQYGGGVVRMHPIDVEADDPGAVLRPEERDSLDARKRRAAFGDQGAFVRVDGALPNLSPRSSVSSLARHARRAKCR